MEKKLINFTISSPGRIVLTGENSAMYGQHFVTAGLNLRTNLEFCELPESKRIIKIDFPSVDLQREISLENVESYFLYKNQTFPSTPMPIESILRYVKYFITINCMWKTFEQRYSLEIFFFLFFLMTDDLDKRPFRVRVTTEIPFGSGFGSSSSFAVCLAACFLHWIRLQSDVHTRFNDDELWEIKNYTELCENFMQEFIFAPGDAYVCIDGRVTKCQLMDYNNYSAETVVSRAGIRILLVELFNQQNKGERAKLMADQYTSRNEFDSMLKKFDEIAIAMYNSLSNFCNININSEDRLAAYYKLLDEIDSNHQLMFDHHLSFEQLNIITYNAKLSGYAGKLSGFEGKYAYIMLPPNITNNDIQVVKNYFNGRGFTNCILTSINCDGLRIDN